MIANLNIQRWSISVKPRNGSLIVWGDVIPTLGVWEHFDEIDFDNLPNQFVLKCTHDSGGLVICRDKSQFDKEAARRKIETCLKHNFFWGPGDKESGHIKL